MAVRDFFPEKIFDQEIFELVENRQSNTLQTIFEDLYPADIAVIIDELENTEDKIFVINLIDDKEMLLDVFEELEWDDQHEIIYNLKNKKLISFILNEMASDDRADFFASLEDDISNKLRENLNPEELKDLDSLLKYGEFTAGGLMTTDYVGLKANITIEQALQMLREKYQEAETINYEFVVDDTNRLQGIVSLRDIIVSEPGSFLKDIMETNTIYAHTGMDQEEVASLFIKYDLTVMAVLDVAGVLKGIITIDDILDVIEEEATEDIQRIGASLPLEESYFDTSIIELIKKRFIWLVGLLIVSAFTASVLKVYDKTLDSLIALAYFIPTITGTGGNTGTQSATMIIRGIALGEIEYSDIFRVLRREFIIGLLMGLMLAVLGFVQSFITAQVVKVSLTLAISLVFTTMASACIGGTLPIIAKKLKFDPAVMSGPFISTVVDVGGLIIYFETAKFIMTHVGVNI
ncbi:MAG: magnesium transporter [Candidatus Muiribacterium halophilum]|uniref:Magnesium transporter MgtE n=1 Tax=Muiribacterium halophilum TaxID=2053465 RepID=A0A2N5Z9D0_MUIH1|nr:MAG: magnesium transporter [Candidatus Muirbacterium halophilum]